MEQHTCINCLTKFTTPKKRTVQNPMCANCTSTKQHKLYNPLITLTLPQKDTHKLHLPLEYTKAWVL